MTVCVDVGMHECMLVWMRVVSLGVCVYVSVFQRPIFDLTKPTEKIMRRMFFELIHKKKYDDDPMDESKSLHTRTYPHTHIYTRTHRHLFTCISKSVSVCKFVEIYESYV